MISNSADSISDLISSADKLREVEHDLNSKIDAANQRLVSIKTAPLTRADFVAAVEKIVQYRAENFGAIMLDWFSRDRISFEFLGLAPNGEFPYRPLETLMKPGKDEHDMIAFCGLFAPQIMEFVNRMADGMDWATDAIPVADRPGLMAEVRREIADLVAERDRVAAALGRKSW